MKSYIPHVLEASIYKRKVSIRRHNQTFNYQEEIRNNFYIAPWSSFFLCILHL